jgi:hypothetical protein
VKHTLASRVGVGFVALVLLLQFIIPALAPKTFGLSAVDNAAINNDWTQWVPDQVCVASTTTGAPLTGKDNEEKAFTYFVQKGLSNEQSAGILGNLMVEAPGVNPFAQQDKSKDPLPKPNVGFGIAQWTDPGRQKGLLALATSTNRPATDLGLQLDYLWQELNTSYKSVLKELKTINDERAAAVMYMIKFESPLEKSPTGPNAKLRSDNATDVLQTYGGGSVAANVSLNSKTGCVTGTGAVSGDIVKTALGYAWDTTGHGPNEADAKPSYRSDMPKFNGAKGGLPFSDCGVFIATVMIASGADTNFPKRVTGVQMDYMAAHKDKYKEVPDVTNTSQLHPGDILVNDDHTFMFVGKESGKKYDSVGGSQFSHVPQPTSFTPGFRVFQFLGNTTSTGLPT